MITCRVVLTNEQNILEIGEDLLHRVMTAACRELGQSLSVSVALILDDAMADLHVRFLSIEGPTDVLTFPYDKEPELTEPGLGEGEEGVDVALDGEIVISTETAVREAGKVGIDPVVEVCLYAVHGVLHLLGHDDHDPDDFLVMHAVETEVLRNELGIDPRILSEEQVTLARRKRGK